MKTRSNNRENQELRRDFNRALYDLGLILPLYKASEHNSVINGYLKAYNLLSGHDSAKGRLFYLLGEL